MNIERLKFISTRVEQLFERFSGNLNNIEQTCAHEFTEPAEVKHYRRCIKRHAVDYKPTEKVHDVWRRIADNDAVGNYIPERKLGHRGDSSWEYWIASTQHGETRYFIKRTVVGKEPPEVSRAKIIAEFALNDFNHPNFVRVLDAGKVTIGNHTEYFVATQYLDGYVTLSQYVKDQKLSIEHAVQIVSTVARAIAALRTFRKTNSSIASARQSELLLHLDLKPGNVMILPVGDNLTVARSIKLIDYGSSGTIEGALGAGTWPYAAIDSRLPNRCPEDKLSWDNYAMGMMILFLISNQHPQPPCQDDLPTTPSQWQQWLDQQPISCPRLRSIVHKSLAFSPADRYTDPELFAEDLAAWLDNEPIRNSGISENWLQQEKLLMKRIWNRNDILDHSRLMVRLASLFVPTFIGIIAFYAVQLSYGLPLKRAYDNCGLTATIISVLIVGVAAISARFNSASLKMYVPILLFALSTAVPPLLLFPAETQTALSCATILLGFGILTASLGFTVAPWSIMRHWGIFILLIATVLAASAREYDLNRFAPPMLWGIFAISNIIFAIGVNREIQAQKPNEINQLRVTNDVNP